MWVLLPATNHDHELFVSELSCQSCQRGLLQLLSLGRSTLLSARVPEDSELSSLWIRRAQDLIFFLDSLPPAIKNKLPFSSYLPSSVYVNFASCYCSNGRDGEMLLISFLRRIFFSKQLVLTRAKQPRNSMLVSQISSNVRALYIVSALAEMKLDYVNVSQPFNLFYSGTLSLQASWTLRNWLCSQ